MSSRADEEASRQDLGVCRRKAMDLLARRPHFRAELIAKLARRGFAPAIVEDTCEWLEGHAYLDDRGAAERLVAGALTRKGYGPARMRAELARRGVAGEIIDRTLAAAWSGGEDERALEIARARAARGAIDRDRLGRHLAGKGYGAGAIYRALDRLERER